MDREIKDKNIFYLNMNLTNQGVSPIPAYVVDQRDGNIIDNPSNWEMSIVRFQVSSELVPLFFPVIPNPAFPLRTNMSITLNYMGNFFQQFVSVTPDQVKWGIFDYCVFLEQVNAAALLAFNAAVLAFPAITAVDPPVFYLNDATSLISMYVDTDYINSNANRIKIGVNVYLQQILDMPCDLRNVVPALNGYDYQIAVNHSALYLTNPVVPNGVYPYGVNLLTGAAYLQVSQEFRSLDEWSFIKSIVFSSSRVPVVHEFLPNLTDQSQNSNVNDSFLPTLTDFDLAKDTTEPTRHTLQYVPTGEYRMISLQGQNGFSAIDVRAQYQTYTGQLYPLYLNPGTNMSLKIMFRRKPDIYTK